MLQYGTVAAVWCIVMQCESVLQCASVYCSVLQGVAAVFCNALTPSFTRRGCRTVGAIKASDSSVCCGLMQCVAVFGISVLQYADLRFDAELVDYKGLQFKKCVAECCSVLQCVAVCCSVLQCVAVCCSVMHCVAAVCCSVLQ